MTIQLSVEQEREFTKLAGDYHCSLDELAQSAIVRFLDDEIEHRAALDRAREDLVAGRLLESDEVWVRIEGILQH